MAAPQLGDGVRPAKSATPAPAPAPVPAPAPRTSSGGTGTRSAATTTATATPTPAIDENLMAQQYGFALAVLNSDPELKSIFQQAVAGTWTSDKFVAAVRNTKWYQQHSEQWRNVQILKASDPATYTAALSQQKTRVAAMAGELGANVSSSLDSLAEMAYVNGWDDNQLRANLATYVQYTDGRMLGQAGQYEQAARQWAYDNGLTLSDSWYQDQVRRAIGGTQTINDIKLGITEMAASAFPNLAERLRTGESLAQIADPYRQSMGSLLEVDPATITLQDPSIKNALSYRMPDGKIATKTLYEFETDVRKDARWKSTKNAQDSLMQAGRSVLRDFGLVS